MTYKKDTWKLVKSLEISGCDASVAILHTKIGFQDAVGGFSGQLTTGEEKLGGKGA